VRRGLTTALVTAGSMACALALTVAPPLPVDTAPARAGSQAPARADVSTGARAIGRIGRCTWTPPAARPDRAAPSDTAT
jgi:hypothetical protein